MKLLDMVINGVGGLVFLNCFVIGEIIFLIFWKWVVGVWDEKRMKVDKGILIILVLRELDLGIYVCEVKGF